MGNARKTRWGDPVIAGVILAAGASARMGQPKQLLDWGGIPLIRHVAGQLLASRVQASYVVLGAHAPLVRAALRDLPLRLVYNRRYRQGLGSSLSIAIAVLPRQTSAALVLLGDQPFVDTALIDRLIAAAERSDALIVAPEAGGRRAHPVLFRAALFPTLLRLQGDQGARQLIAEHQDRLLLLPAPSALDADLDTPEDYARLRPAL